MGRHETRDTFDAVVSDYVTGRARELIKQADDAKCAWTAEAMAGWIGAAAEILRELTRDA